MAPATRVLCTCRKCVTFQCINPATGIPQLGQLVTVKTQRSNLIKSEQQSVWVHGADKQGPSTNFDPSDLKTTLFYVTKMISTYTSSCMLKMDRELVRLVATQGLQTSSTQKQQSLSTPPILSYANELTIKAIPIDTQTVLKHMSL
ncbi:hypothetical protein H4Q26_010645 [Puccinia striiformis f. sp. tritici PST-130]|nr:hypothetical protein H4Q26_010645 [Puccinia striiformis f. sp. tritici PST-130]